MDLKQEIRDFFTFLMEHHLETKFNISKYSRRSEGEQDLVFKVNSYLKICCVK